MRSVPFACLLMTLPWSAMAARPMVTDDARLTTAGSCQLETWTRRYRDSHEVWAIPACNPTGNLELAIGAGRAQAGDGNATNDYVLQAKTLFRQLAADDWGWGLTAGTVRHPEIQPGPNLLGNTYAYLPASLSLSGDRLVLHANAGWLRMSGTGRDSMTWGLGAELRTGRRMFAIAEAFGDDRDQPYWQLGARFAIVPDRVQIDATIGRQFAGPVSGRWLSFGLRLTPARLF